MRVRRRTTSYLALVGCLIGISGTVRADEIISSSTGLSSPASTITFGEIVLPNNAPLTNQYASLGVTFSGGFYYNPCPACAIPPPTGAAPWITDFPSSDTPLGSALTTISFSGPIDGVAFNFASEFQSYTFTAFLGGTDVAQFTVPVGTSAVNGTNGWGWYGFSNVTLDSLQIAGPVPTIGEISGYEIDNLELGPASASSVPEPSSLILLSTVLLGVAFATRRTRRLQRHSCL